MSSNSKIDFAKLTLSIADEFSSDNEKAKEYLTEQGFNVNSMVSEGLNRIKKMQLQLNAEKTRKEQSFADSFKLKAKQFVETILDDKNFSFQAFVQKENLSVSFRNFEALNQDEVKEILIRHYMLKLLNGSEL